MPAEKVKYFSVNVFIIKDFCTVQTFPLLLAYLKIRFLKLQAQLVCCMKTCFWTIRRSDLDNEINFSKCSILLKSYRFQITQLFKRFLDNVILTLVKCLQIRVVAPLGQEQLLCLLSSSDIFFKVIDQTQKWDTQTNRDRGQIHFFNSGLLQIVPASGIISRNIIPACGMMSPDDTSSLAKGDESPLASGDAVDRDLYTNNSGILQSSAW